MLTIGDFARLAGVSVRMLRHYDKLGLLTPARVDESSGYRFYAAGQLDRANRLVALKSLGFSLEQVGSLLDDDLPDDDLLALMRTRRDELCDQIAADTDRLRAVEVRLRAVAAGPGREFSVKSLESLRLAGLSTRVAEMDEIGGLIGSLFVRVERIITAAGVQRRGPGIGLYSTDGDAMVALAAEQLEPGEVPVGLEAVTVPAAERGLCTSYRDDAEIAGIDRAWQSLAKETERRGFLPCGAAREVYLSTPFDPGGSGAWAVELQQPFVVTA